MSDPASRATAPAGIPSVLLLASVVAVLNGCGGNDDAMRPPVRPLIANLSATAGSLDSDNSICYEFVFDYEDPDGDVLNSPVVRFQTRFNTGDEFDQTRAGEGTGTGARGSVRAVICHFVVGDRTTLDQDVSMFDAAGNESNSLGTTLSLPTPNPAP